MLIIWHLRECPRVRQDVFVRVPHSLDSTPNVDVGEARTGCKIVHLDTHVHAGGLPHPFLIIQDAGAASLVSAFFAETELALSLPKGWGILICRPAHREIFALCDI